MIYKNDNIKVENESVIGTIGDLKDIQEQIDLYINNGYEIIKIEINKMEKNDTLIESEIGEE